jgi:hypothetical protein
MSYADARIAVKHAVENCEKVLRKGDRLEIWFANAELAIAEESLRRAK